MKKLMSLIILVCFSLHVRAWHDPGHLLTAMIAYLQLDEQARTRVDALTDILGRDYPYVNHFIATGPWPDDLKAEGVRAYDTWHYTNIPYNWQGVPLPPKQTVDIVWAIDEAQSILRSPRARDIDKARFLGFLVHFVSDLHQPLHSTSVHDNTQPGGNAGGNGFTLQGPWRNLHMLWDAAAGYLDAYRDINPYGEEKDALTLEEIERLRQLAVDLIQQYPESRFPAVEELNPEFWALESHQLAVRYGYRAVNGQDDRGRNLYLEPGGAPSEFYLENAREIARQRLALSGYRLGRMLNQLFGKQPDPAATSEAEPAVLAVVKQILQAINTGDPDLARPILLEEAVVQSIRERDGRKITGQQTAKQFLNGLKRGTDKWTERIWNPTVNIHGEIATVWAPYDFHINGAFSHCGTDIFNLIKTAEGWKVSALTYDVIKEGCAPSPLGPVGSEKTKE